MFKVLILLCSINLAPSECQMDNAIDVINGPDAQNEVMCGFYGQAYIADRADRQARRRVRQGQVHAHLDRQDDVG